MQYPDVDVIWESEDGQQRIVLAYDEYHTTPYDDGSTPIIVQTAWHSPAEQLADRTSYELPTEILAAYDHFCRYNSSLRNQEAFERYLRIFHGTTSVVWAYEGNPYVTFDTADWREAMGLTEEYLADKPQFLDGTLANMDEVISWINGEVYYARLERKVIWYSSVNGDIDNVDENQSMATWDTVVSVGVLFGYEWAVEGAKEYLLPVASTTQV